MDSLVSTEWLADEIGAEDLRIVDATWLSPEMKRDAAGEHAAAHIPGARFLDLGTLVDAGNPAPNMLPSEAMFADRMSAMGLGGDYRIILYDNSPYRTSARAWWMLDLFGVRRVAVLDGGWSKWRAESRATDAGGKTAQPADFHARADWSGVRSKADIESNIHTGDEQLLDARSAARFTGDEADPRPGVAPGHIPGALNLPYAQLFNRDGTWKRGDVLAAVYLEAGIDLDRPVVTTCGSGSPPRSCCLDCTCWKRTPLCTMAVGPNGAPTRQARNKPVKRAPDEQATA